MFYPIGSGDSGADGRASSTGEREMSKIHHTESQGPFIVSTSIDRLDAGLRFGT